MKFFGALFGWQAERVAMEGHISHYTINTTTTIRILDDLDSPPVVPNYAVADVAHVIRRGRVQAAGGSPTPSPRRTVGDGRVASTTKGCPYSSIVPADITRTPHQLARRRASSDWCSSAPT